MYYHLTFGDRKLFLDIFEKLQSEITVSDETLIDNTSDWTAHVNPTMSYERDLVHNVAILSNYLRVYSGDDRIAGIARGALLYFVESDQTGSRLLKDFGLVDDAFIANYAVHEVRSLLGERVVYSPPQLTIQEKKKAEAFLLTLRHSTNENDITIIKQCREILQRITTLVECGLYTRLQLNIDYLIQILISPDKEDNLMTARSALKYLILEDDAINDRLGIIGYLDDYFIIQLAVDIINPKRTPWLDLLDQTLAKLPFLDNLYLNSDEFEYKLSEYMIVNSALTCPELRENGDLGHTILICGPASMPQL
jgi:uncharacterized membrane protein YkvA (DUF1232 family)